MKLSSILGRIGSAALKSIPGVGAAAEVIGFINDCLPAGDKVSMDTPGDEAMSKIERLQPNIQAQILEQQFDVEIASINAHVEIQKSLSSVDIQGASTRPHVAKLFAWNTVIISDLIIFGVFWAMVNDKVQMVEQIKQLWPFIIGILSPFVVLLRSYFGMRTKEKSHKYHAVSGTAPAESIVSNIVRKITG